jgi:BolA family transcriptional regulator, general stress-responsive regulator
MSAEQLIREKLMIELEPTRLDVINESHMHAGHRASPDTGDSHFRVLIVSPKFAGKSRVERHRMVNAALAELLRGSVHALAIRALSPDESLSEPRSFP